MQFQGDAKRAKLTRAHGFFGVTRSSQHIGKTFPQEKFPKRAFHKLVDQQLLLTCRTKPHSGTRTGLQRSQSGISGSVQGLSKRRCSCKTKSQKQLVSSVKSLPPSIIFRKLRYEKDTEICSAWMNFIFLWTSRPHD